MSPAKEETVGYLIIDSNENENDENTGRVSALKKFFAEKGFKTRVVSLKVGDYAYSPDGVFVSNLIGFEFKTPSDFLASIPKLKEQAVELAQTYQHPYIIVEGNITQLLLGRNYHPNSIFGIIASLYAHCNTRVIFAESYYPHIMYYLIAKHTDNKTAIEEYKPFRPSPTKRD